MLDDDDDITANLVLSGVQTLDPSLQPYYMAQASAQEVICQQCLFLAQCVETIIAQTQVADKKHMHGPTQQLTSVLVRTITRTQSAESGSLDVVI